jgi:DNA polymerase (family 10)
MSKILVDIFTKLAKFYKIEEDRFRSQAFEKAIPILANLDPDKDILQQLDKISGIGEGIKKRVSEILETGKLKEVEKLSKDPKIKNLIEFESIYGVGPKKAEKLYKKYKTLSKLKSEIKKGRNVDLNDSQKLGVMMFKEFNTRFPRSECAKLDKQLSSVSKNGYLIVGSYRRKKESLGDIDILVWDKKSYKKLIKFFTDQPKHHIIKEGRTATSFLVKMPYFSMAHVVDIRYIKDPNGAAELYFTGSRDFNRYMRSQAKKMGYLLNEYGLHDRKTGHIIKTKNESDIFGILKMKYIEPENRN